MINGILSPTFANSLDKDGIVSGHDETESPIVSVDDHHPRLRIRMAGDITTVTTAANQTAVD